MDISVSSLINKLLCLLPVYLMGCSTVLFHKESFVMLGDKEFMSQLGLGSMGNVCLGKGY